jgi:hypothetical protein
MSPRLGIVGAGPGGLSLARLLSERGIDDVTVIERSDRVGGKSLTVQHQGIGHEMGTCYVADGYTTVRAWMQEAGIGEHVMEHQQIRAVGGDLLDFKDFVTGSAGILGATAQVTRYVADWLQFHDWDLRGNPDGAPGTVSASMREEVAQPFGAWLRARDLDVVSRFALRSMTVMGYGSLDRVPALYGLRWNMPSLLWSAVTTHIVEPTPGWQPLWAHLAGALDVRLEHEITAVERRAGEFLVRTDQGDLALDHLVISCPLDEAASWFPFDDAERHAYSIGDDDALGWGEFVTTLVDVAGWYRDSDTWCSEARTRDPASLAGGHLIGARRTGDKSPVAKARSRTRPSVYVCYQYGAPEHSDAAMLATLRADLALEGGTINSVLRQCRWRYSPQLTPAAIRGGAVARMERQQGRGNLWIAGATTCHEAVDNIVDYNRRLVERIATALDGGDPSSPAMLASLADRFRFSLDDK